MYSSQSQKVTQLSSVPQIQGLTTLENCSSNLYQLLDLNGIRWQKFYPNDFKFPTLVKDFQTFLPLEIELDQILKLYAKCMQSGILACWRRKPNNNTYGDNNPTANKLFARVNRSKEVWLFWWKHEDETVKEITSKFPDLQSENEQNLADGACLGYEIRCLIFKAIHNQIENRLTTLAGYIRIGRWFIKPRNRSSSKKDNKKDPKNLGDTGLNISSSMNDQASTNPGASSDNNANSNNNSSSHANFNNQKMNHIVKELLSDSWNHRISLAFNFFLHADTNVICSIETCQHDELVTVSSELITILSQSGYGAHSGQTIGQMLVI